MNWKSMMLAAVMLAGSLGAAPLDLSSYVTSGRKDTVKNTAQLVTGVDTAGMAGAVSQHVEQAIAAIPAPTGVPIWYDSSDSNYFATCSSGTGYVWKVTCYTNATPIMTVSNLVSYYGDRPPLGEYPVPFTDGLWRGYVTNAIYYLYCDSGGSYWSTDWDDTGYPRVMRRRQGGQNDAAVRLSTSAFSVTNFYTRLASTNDLSRYTTLDAFVAGTNMISDQLIAIQNNAAAMAAIVTNAPAWQVYSNRTGSVTLTNSLEKPVILQGTGAVSLAFSGLRSPRPLYAVLAGYSSVSFPSNAYFVGGGAWQTNRANHFVIWSYGSGLYVNPLTTTE